MTIVPVYNQVILPDSKIYFQRENLMTLSNEEPEIKEEVIFLVLKENKENEHLSLDDFYPIGVIGMIEEMNNNYVLIKTHDRVNLKELNTLEDQRIEVVYTDRADMNDLSEEESNEKLKQMKKAMISYFSQFRWGIIARQYVNGWKSMSEIICAVNYWLNMTHEEKYALLETDSIAQRIQMIETGLYEFLELSKVSNEAENAQEEDHQKIYREQAIKKQIEYLQNELDQMHPDEVSDVRSLETKIKKAGMSQEAQKEADKALNRMKQEGSNSPEYGMLYNYLDFMTSLPWKKARNKKIDLNEAEKVLNSDHYGLDKVKKRILQQIAVMELNKKQSGSILLFVGAPGTGKTSIARSIADALKRKYVRIALGGVRDEADIRGHRRTYIGAMPGRIMDGLSKSGSSNNVMVLDEIDKLSQSYNGDPAAALLEVLDPEQNNTFTDHYMNVSYDLSDILFICTANSLDSIPEPLLNRMEVISFNGYTQQEKLQIAKRHLLPQSMEKMGISSSQMKLPDQLLKTIIADYTIEAGVRGLKKRLDTICRVAAVNLVKGKKDFKVTAKKLPDILDMSPLKHEHINENKKPGIVSGLAWTTAGGEILFIETLLVPGNNKVIITGQLGDVMKESVSIALSLVKSMFPKEAEVFKEHDIHIHVPAGATPKDGPSAGITLTTAIASLITEKAVDSSFAMTGEVSLRGVVMSIGGLPEKLMAAQRSGVKTVFIPKDNVNDLKDVPKEVKDKLTIIPVSLVSEVLKQTKIIS